MTIAPEDLGATQRLAQAIMDEAVRRVGSIGKLAKKAHLDRPHLYKCGKNGFSLSTLVRLARACGVPVSVLVQSAEAAALLPDVRVESAAALQERWRGPGATPAAREEWPE